MDGSTCSAIFTPEAGKLSDRHASSFGRRRAVAAALIALPWTRLKGGASAAPCAHVSNVKKLQRRFNNAYSVSPLSFHAQKSYSANHPST